MTPASGPSAMVIALDGPAASGKSTVGRAAAHQLGFFYFDTGLLYRALTRLALDQQVSVEDGEALGGLARQVDLQVLPSEAGGEVLADGVDLTPRLRSAEVEANVSAVAAHAAVRDALVAAQRAVIHPPGTILAGRDIGTVIAPDADLKIWLTASLQERAARRARESRHSAAEVQESMQRRDSTDSARAVAPLVKATDAVELATDGLTIDQVVERLVQLVRARMVRSPGQP